MPATTVDSTSVQDLQPAPGARRWALPLVLLLVGMLAFGGFSVLSQKLAGAQDNRTSSYLPKSAESTKALNLTPAFFGAESVPTIVVWERASGLTPADTTALGEAVKRIAAVPGQVGAPSPLVVSGDGKAAQSIVQLPSGLADFSTPVEAMRTAANVDGLTSHVTGTGGLSADFSKAFAGIDGKLLYTAGLVVLLILLVVYRSPVFVPVLLSVGLALVTSQGVIYLFADSGALTVNGQSAGILLVLVFGAGTDYALLLISRYKEELHAYDGSFLPMVRALRASAPAIVASGCTVILGLLCLLLSDLASNKSLGPVAAIGIACAMLSMLLFLPALLVALGRWWFWPFPPRHDNAPQQDKGLWASAARLVGRRSTVVWVVTSLVLLLLAGFSLKLDANGITQAQSFTTSQDSVTGQQVFDRHFAAGSGDPTSVIGPAGKVDALVSLVKQTPGVADAVPFTGGDPTAAPKVVGGRVLVLATLTDPADSAAAQQTVKHLRTTVDAAGEDVLVGGATAIGYDFAQGSIRDNRIIIPAVLIVIFIILTLLLRSLVAPVLLVASVVLSFMATLGVCGFVFHHIFDFAGEDQSFPLYAFIFLVALGIDYNIFLMTRVREESEKSDTRRGVLRGLAVTGGVITSAGLVLAATFGALGVLPIVFLAELGFAVAFGVLLDTLLVRSLLVPAAVYDLDSRTWWPLPLRKERSTSTPSG